MCLKELQFKFDLNSIEKFEPEPGVEPRTPDL